MSAPSASNAPAAAAKPKKTGVPCGCGCGEITNPGRSFRQGHDARVPLGASCRRCKATGTFAVGKVPACDAHLPAIVKAEAADGRVSVRSLPKPPAAKPAPAKAS